MTGKRVLISGASVAGPTLAYWLNRYGWRTTIVERAPELRTGGQNVDVRGAGRDVARRMQLEDDIRAATTGEVGTRFIAGDGSTVAEFPAGTSDSGGATAELEILRGDLARLLVERTSAATEYRFGDRITGIRDSGDAVTVSFESAPDEEFDLVIAADGIGSGTRRLALGSPVEIRSLGMETTWATIPRVAGDDDWWRWYNAPGGRTVTLRPDPVGTIRATLSVMTGGTDARGRGAGSKATDARGRGGGAKAADARGRGSGAKATDAPGAAGAGAADLRSGAETRTPDEQRAHLRRVFAGAGWETERVLDALDATDDLYFETVGQVHASRWSNGRFAVVGDAAYCASPISGMGTSLALVGAYVLAGELAAHVDHRDAFAGYERLMRPYVDQAQKLPPGTPRVANPQTRAGIAALHAVVRLGATSFAGKLGARFVTPPADAITLPDYTHLER